MEDGKKESSQQEAEDSAQNQEEEPEEAEQKYGDLNEGAESKTQILNSKNEDISEMLKISHLKAEDQTWEMLGLPSELIEKLITKGFKGPSRIQFQVMSMLNAAKAKGQSTDIVAQSQNGSGKTLSFLVPALAACSKGHKGKEGVPHPEIVILADTKELIHQICKIISLIKPDGLKEAYHVKDTANQALDADLSLLVTTVDSCAFMIDKKKIKLANLKMLIIDEADKIILNDNVKHKLPFVFKSIPKTSIIGLFSATLPDKCISILQGLKREFNRIVVDTKTELSLKGLKHYYVMCSRDQKVKFVDAFLKGISTGNVILFVNSRNFAEVFGKALVNSGHKAEILLGDMDLNDRIQVLDEFKAGKIKILVTTNLLSRGIDARKVSVVINVDMPLVMEAKTAYDKKGPRKPRSPLDLETYLHRCGRTARFGDMGLAVNLIEEEKYLDDIRLIEEKYGIKMEEIGLTTFEEVLTRNKENLTFNEKKHKQHEEDI